MAAGWEFYDDGSVFDRQRKSALDSVTGRVRVVYPVIDPQPSDIALRNYVSD
jgi:hypothetical protein